MGRHRTDAVRSTLLYGAAHACVDGSCAALVFSASATGRLSPTAATAAVLMHNLLAFATQPLLGWFVRDAEDGRRWALAGSLATSLSFALGWVVPDMLWPAIASAAVGNAVFHVGGGVVSLRAEPGKAALPGLFVAPGAAGLAAGVAMGSAQWLPWLPAALLSAAIPLFRLVRLSSPCDSKNAVPHERKAAPAAALPLAAVLALLAVIVGRSVLGGGLALPWKSEPALLVALTAAVVLGKGAGGILADRFGRLMIGAGSLAASLPLLVWAPTHAAAGIAGLLLFNMTMPITLVALADLMPERPGFAFGLTCLALVGGVLPFALGLASPLAPATVAAWVAASALLLAAALGRRSRSTAAVRTEPTLEEAL